MRRRVVKTQLCPLLVTQGGGSNRGPLAIAGPDRTLFLPVSGLLLDGSGSTDDRGLTSYHWDALRWETDECLATAASDNDDK